MSSLCSNIPRHLDVSIMRTTQTLQCSHAMHTIPYPPSKNHPHPAFVSCATQHPPPLPNININININQIESPGLPTVSPLHCSPFLLPCILKYPKEVTNLEQNSNLDSAPGYYSSIQVRFSSPQFRNKPNMNPFPHLPCCFL